VATGANRKTIHGNDVVQVNIYLRFFSLDPKWRLIHLYSLITYTRDL
jgi:hypothetical protein